MPCFTPEPDRDHVATLAKAVERIRAAKSTERDDEITQLKALITKMIPHLDAYITQQLSEGAYGMGEDLDLLEQARKATKS
jgi:hypothetical protein